MFNPDNMPDSVIQSVKRHLHITWSDSDTDARLLDMICDAEAALNHKLGAVIDYMQVGAERRLFLNYLLYAWNDALEQFDAAYRAEIIQIRHKYEVARFAEEEDG